MCEHFFQASEIREQLKLSVDEFLDNDFRRRCGWGSLKNTWSFLASGGFTSKSNKV